MRKLEINHFEFAGHGFQIEKTPVDCAEQNVPPRLARVLEMVLRMMADNGDLAKVEDFVAAIEMEQR